MPTPERTSAALQPTDPASAGDQTRRTSAAVHADYQRLVRELTELTQEEFDRPAGETHPSLKVAVRIIR